MKYWRKTPQQHTTTTTTTTIFEGCKHGRIYPILLVESFACLIQSMLQKKGLGFKGYQELSGKERVLGFRVFKTATNMRGRRA